jgi:hypothetical protein
MSKPFNGVKVWRNSFQAPGKEPTFSGGWIMGDGWKKQQWASRDTIVECRTIPGTAFHSASFANGNVYIEAHRLSLRKSYESAKFFYATTQEPYDGPVNYTEEARDDD